MAPSGHLHLSKGGVHTSASWSQPDRGALKGLSLSLDAPRHRPALLGILALNLQMAQTVGIYMGGSGSGELKNHFSFFLVKK